jgi:hypothetical protein
MRFEESTPAGRVLPDSKADGNLIRIITMHRQLIGIAIVGALLLTGCDSESSTPAGKAEAAQRAVTDAVDQAAQDTKAAVDAKVASDSKAAAAAKTAADRAAADTKAATDTRIAAELKAAGDAKIAADRGAVDAKAAADAKIAADLKAAHDAKAQADLAADAAADKAADADAAAKATSLLGQLREQIKDGKIELADATLAQIDDMTRVLPASLQAEIEIARTELKAKKAAAALR